MQKANIQKPKAAQSQAVSPPPLQAQVRPFAPITTNTSGGTATQEIQRQVDQPIETPIAKHHLSQIKVQTGSAPTRLDRSFQPQPSITPTAATVTLQRKPDDVWNHVQEKVAAAQGDPQQAKTILKQDFYSNWFLAKDYLLDKDKWVQQHHKSAEEFDQQSESFKQLMKALIALRNDETNQLLGTVRTELKAQPAFQGLPDKQVLDWGAAGSTSLTSDIDYNLKGAGSIQAVGLFNQKFKTQLGWTLDPGTVYDVNVYAQDFMTPGNGGKPFEKNDEQRTIAPVQEVEALNGNEARNSPTFNAFDAFALNQDVWSLVKMRMYMTNAEWTAHCNSMLSSGNGPLSDDAIARDEQIKAQISDANTYYTEYCRNIAGKVHEIEQSMDPIYVSMRETLAAGSQHLSEHQAESSKKMMASNLIYQEKLAYVLELRQILNALKAEVPVNGQPLDPKLIPNIKEVGLRLKNALSEAILYSNEAYFTQGAVHFSVIGQQIGKGQSTLLMSDDEHLHSFREQVGDTLKVLHEYEHASMDKALLKAGKYIDRMAKSAIPLLKGEFRPVGYEELQALGAMAAKLKSDKTDLEDLNDQARPLTQEDSDRQSSLSANIPQQTELFKAIANSQFESVAHLRETVVKVGQAVEQEFRQSQLQQNTEANAPQVRPQDPQLQVVQANIQQASRGLSLFDRILATLGL